MNLEEKWRRTLEDTKILRFHRYPLSHHAATTLPYVFLAASSINVGDSVVRKGNVVVDRPLILLPRDMPQFSGFELEDDMQVDAESLRLFFMVRGIRFPSLKYRHESSTLDVAEGPPEENLKKYRNELEQKEDLSTGLLAGISECWQLSVLLYVVYVINKSTPSDIRKFLDDLRRGLLP